MNQRMIFLAAARHERLYDPLIRQIVLPDLLRKIKKEKRRMQSLTNFRQNFSRKVVSFKYFTRMRFIIYVQP